MKLSARQLEFYEKYGYLIVAELFNDATITAMKTISSDLANETKQFSSEYTGDSFEDLRGTSVVLTKNSKSQQVIKRVVWAGAANPSLLTFGRTEEILTPVSQLLESEEADHLINQIHYKTPGDEVSFPWHQDEQNRRAFDPQWEDVNKKGSFVQTLCAIDNCTKDNGPIYVLPGSHLWGYFNFGKFLQTTDLQKRLAYKGVNAKAEQIPLLINAGDVIFMHPRLIHGSWPNTSNEPRRLFINGFSYPGANHKPYPGTGSAKRISLITGQELSFLSEKQSEAHTGLNAPIKFQAKMEGNSNALAASTSLFTLFSPFKAEEKQYDQAPKTYCGFKPGFLISRRF